MALMLIRDIEPKEERSIPPLRDILLRADPVGTALSIPGLILLIYSLTSSNIIGWDNGAVIGTLVVAVLFLAGFVLVEAKFTKFPLVPRHLWKGGNLAIACGLAAFTYAIWQGANYFLTLELQGSIPSDCIIVRRRAYNACCGRFGLYPASNSDTIPSSWGDCVFG